MTDVVVVGAGLAGLRCAGLLTRSGLAVRVLEASDGVGGRVRTDLVDGFRCDRGFQLLNDGYPEARRALDLEALRLGVPDASLVVRSHGVLHHLGNPLQQPSVALSTVGTGLIGVGQELRLARYAAAAVAGPPGRIRARVDLPAREAWHRAGLTDDTIRSVLTPFFSGVVLEEEFTTSRRFLDLMLRMFAVGRSTLPAAGMQALPEQLAARLRHPVSLDTAVEGVGPTEVVTSAGTVSARAVVVAVDAWSASSLVPRLGAPPAANGVTTVYHSAPLWPGQRSRLVVDADGSPVANSMVLSVAAPSYAPDGRALVATSVLHRSHGRAVEDREMLSVLASLYEQPTETWERIATYDLPRALPSMPAPHGFRRPVRVAHEDGRVYVCGDHRDTSSLQGALVSGRRAAEAVVADLTG